MAIVAVSCYLMYIQSDDSTRIGRKLGKMLTGTKYSGCVAEVREYLVSSSGQMSLPAAARHRWDLDDGGPVDVVDLGFGVLTLPQGEGRRLLNDLVRDEHAAFVRSLNDPELATS